MSLLMRFLTNESGATAIEYAMVAGGIALAIIAVVQGLGLKVQSAFSSAQSVFN
jgi:pilus assembly protein Flp/PilA